MRAGWWPLNYRARHAEEKLSRPDKARRLWLTFLRNHREVIAALNFFTVPTITFRVLYCLFVEHGRHKILHFNVTERPSEPRVLQQLREAFSECAPYRYVILDRNSKLGNEVADLLSACGTAPTRTSFRSPWQDGVAERWIGSCRREMLDHVIILDVLDNRVLFVEVQVHFCANPQSESLTRERGYGTFLRGSSGWYITMIVAPIAGGFFAGPACPLPVAPVRRENS